MHTVRIDKMVYGGNGVATSGETLPFVLPGEMVETDGATVTKIIEASSDRVAPECVHFGVCGGCNYQHSRYSAQLALKREILQATFAGVGLEGIPPVQMHSGQSWTYRSRIRLRVGLVDGEFRVGYNRLGATGGEALVPIVMCPISAPILMRAADAVIALAKVDTTARTWISAAVELEVFTNSDETGLQLTLFTRKPPVAGFERFCKALQRSVPELKGAGVAVLPKTPSSQGRRAEHAKPGSQWGAPGMIYEVGDDRHWVSRGAFFQVNRYLAPELLRVAIGERTGRLAWDLYAGVGLFSRALVSRYERVLAVEAGEPAATDLAAALKGKQHRALAMTTLDFLLAAVVQRERPQLIVMDPPRSGVGTDACALLATVACPEIVYVSCDPVTLARDVKQLADAGYTLSEVHLVDMFPQTFHMETVVVLRR